MKTTFRKVAPVLWSEPHDPSTYGEIDLDLTEVEAAQKENPFHILSVLFKALNEGYKAEPQVNSQVRFLKVVPRKDFCISLMVPHQEGDLCFSTLRELEDKGILQIDIALKAELAKVRKNKGVQEFYRLFKILNFTPRILIFIITPLLRFLLSRDYFKIPWVPRAPFGAMIVSNVGSLGFDRALLPLVSLTKASVLVSFGRVSKKPMVFENQVRVGSSVTVGFNLDHRIMDGFHAQRFIVAFKAVFENPKKYL